MPYKPFLLVNVGYPAFSSLIKKGHYSVTTYTIHTMHDKSGGFRLCVAHTKCV